ncbi:EF-hand domain-containing family member C2 isoform X2 [Oryzias latipes]|uniref:EF-hand domain-containing family member C2 n=1 Tax=Oryzias latipes TaxID=8090 RepID=H2MF63_ORYLA|nr:EF-hand domain-containing family member C2 isoform X2 [Oryzias latipes]
MSSLPFLPGNSFDLHLGRERFHKSQHFALVEGLPKLVGLEKPGIGGEPLPGQKIKAAHSVYPKVDGSHVPSWLAFDKQVLCFEAYFQEKEPYQIRKCKVYFYPEDDTIKVVEPVCKNSGIPQGTLIYRHRIPLPPPNDDQYYKVFHFNINQQVVFYSRTFTLTNCDTFTRNFLTRLGVQLNDPAPVPDDPYSRQRQQFEKNTNPIPPYEKNNKLRQFLDYDRQVLRFYCFWNDQENPSAKPRELILHYFLFDDTIQIHEVTSAKAGNKSAVKFLQRRKLPKSLPAQVDQLGGDTESILLNVLGSDGLGNRFMADRLKTGAVKQDFYKDCDLRIGGEVNVWGRRVVIADCDEFTKQHYRFKYGIEDFTPVKYKLPPTPKPPKTLPPYNGFGSEEDSLSSCYGIQLRRPRKDLQSFLEKDSIVLKFRAKMKTDDGNERKRKFVISFYPCDGTMSVYELSLKSSGMPGGKFLRRSVVKKPGQSKPSERYTAQDLYVGAELHISGQTFMLVNADEYTLKYMEQHAEEFSKANTGNILSKLRSIPEDKKSEIKKFLTLSDPNNTGLISYESFRNMLMDLDCGLVDHEVLVLGRTFSEQQQPEDDVALMLAVAQDTLRRKLYDDFQSLTLAFNKQDPLKNGRIPRKMAWNICESVHLPVSENLLGTLLTKFEGADGIDYQAFLAGINWVEHPASPVKYEDILRFEVNARVGAVEAGRRNVNYSALLQDVLNLSSNCKDAE